MKAESRAGLIFDLRVHVHLVFRKVLRRHVELRQHGEPNLRVRLRIAVCRLWRHKLVAVRVTDWMGGSN